MKQVSKKYTQIKEYKLKNGETKYGFTLYLGVNPDTGNDKSVTRSSFNTVKQAELAIDKLKYEFRLGRNPESNLKKFKEVYAEWDAQYKASGVKMSTYSKTEGYFKNHILPFFGEMKVSKITVRHCEEFSLMLSKKLKHFHHVINYTKDVLETAVRYSYIHTNPFYKMHKYPREKKHIKQDKYLETHELKLVLEFAAQKDFETYAMLRLLNFSGIRKGELRILTWSDINFEQKTLSIYGSYSYSKHNNGDNISTTKTAEDRRLYLDDKTLEVLKEWKQKQVEHLAILGVPCKADSNQLVFANTKNNIVKDYYPNKLFNAVLAELKLRQIVIHGLRHTHATHLAESGAPFYGIQQRLGHSSNQNTTVGFYIHPTEQIKQLTLSTYMDYLNSKGIY
ncbi:site-specific integrase [Lysinibacillus sp. KU-BSD001]|uniref:tyrosine-type recombinase/integrase n=1 Tax=Lysinibacillus sp. KU-BSD001 TaxID=3141328 RepID=UPI0036F12DD4